MQDMKNRGGLAGYRDESGPTKNAHENAATSNAYVETKEKSKTKRKLYAFEL